MSTFDSTKRLLPEILAEIVKAKIQLPDFQRGWVWDDQHIRSLLVSIARPHPFAVRRLWKHLPDDFQIHGIRHAVGVPGSQPSQDSAGRDGTGQGLGCA